MNCTRCEGTGFLDLEEGDGWYVESIDNSGEELSSEWIRDVLAETDARICDCCGDGDTWYGERGAHDGRDFGETGPYAYNGGLPECN